eukprot:3393540-Prymnesium_polylepis.1
MLGLAKSAHAHYGWRSYARVARRGFKRNMHRALGAAQGLVHWSGIALLLQTLAWSLQYAPAVRRCPPRSPEGLWTVLPHHLHPPFSAAAHSP